MSATIRCEHLAVSFGARPLFSGLELTVAPGHVVAVVGANGSGKSTLLRVIAGELAPEAGRVVVSPSEATIGYLPQSVPRSDESILDFVARRTGVAEAQLHFDAATAALGAGVKGADDDYSDRLERWLQLGGADLEFRLAEVCARVGLDVPIDEPLGALSGGQAARAALASILASQFDVLLLDEPTNNLDATGARLITEFVRGLGIPVLVASHDRAFLDDVATSVVELDIAQQQVNQFTGGWSEYRDQKQLRRRQKVEAREAFEAKRDALVARARQQNEWAEKGRAGAEKLGDHMQSAKLWAKDKARKQDQRAARLRAAVDRLDEAPELRKEWELRYSLHQAPESTEVVCSIDGLMARAGDFVVGPLSTTIARGDRIALVGDNGSGKSTLLAALLGSAEHGGRVTWGARTAVGVMDQHRAMVDMTTPIGQQLEASLGVEPAEVRTLLAKFGLGAEHVDRPAGSLSLGERTRAILAMWQHSPTNVLVLDEPTNHLDVPAIEQLQAALESYTGTLLLVTHDLTLLRSFAPNVAWRFTREGDRGRVDVLADPAF